MKTKYLTAYNFCQQYAEDLISFPVDHKLESINENVKNIKIDPESWLQLPKTFFLDTLYIHCQRKLYNSTLISDLKVASSATQEGQDLQFGKPQIIHGLA